MSVEEAAARVQRLARMRNLLLRQESRAKRLRRIKSRTFHKLLRRSQQQEELKLLREGGGEEGGGEGDKEAQRAAAIKQEFLRARVSRPLVRLGVRSYRHLKYRI